MPELVVTFKGAPHGNVLVERGKRAVWPVSSKFPTDPQEDPELLEQRQAYIDTLRLVVEGRIDVLDTTNGLAQYNLGIFEKEKFPTDLIETFTNNTNKWFANRVAPCLSPLLEKSQDNKLLSWSDIFESDEEKKRLEGLVAHLFQYDQGFLSAVEKQSAKKVTDLSKRIADKLAEQPGGYANYYSLAHANIPKAVSAYIFAETAGLLAMRLRGYNVLFYQHTDLGLPLTYLATLELKNTAGLKDSNLEPWADLIEKIDRSPLKIILVSRYIPKNDFGKAKNAASANGHVASPPIGISQQKKSPPMGGATAAGSPPGVASSFMSTANGGRGGLVTPGYHNSLGRGSSSTALDARAAQTIELLLNSISEDRRAEMVMKLVNGGNGNGYYPPSDESQDGFPDVGINENPDFEESHRPKIGNGN